MAARTKTIETTPLGKHAASPVELQARLQAEQQGQPFLVYRGATGRQSLFTLHPGKARVTIGRGPSNDIALGWDTEVSRLHAELEKFGSEWTLVDDGQSRGGTLLNGNPVSGRQRLRDGDVIQAGQTLIAIRIPKSEPSRAMTAGGRRLPKLTPAQKRVLEALCRPYKETEFATPATNQAIAEELFLSVDAVKAHLRTLFAAFAVDDVAPGQRRSALALRAMQHGLVD